MKYIFSVLLCLAIFLPPAFAEDSPVQKTIGFKTNDGKDAGQASLEQTPSGVIIRLNVQNLKPGWHAMHLHEKGDCSPPDSFTNAGNHFNPGGHEHGFEMATGSHAGDMPNILVNEKGRAELEVYNPAVSLKAGDPASLLDTDGSALIIHEKMDDYRSQPGGDAGGRAACAALMP